MSDTEDAEILAYMSMPAPHGILNDKRRLDFTLGRHRTVRDIFMLRKLQKEEYEAYTDTGYRTEKLNKLQTEFRENYIERLTIVTELRKINARFDDPLIPKEKKIVASEKIEEAEVLSYMSTDGPATELATGEDRKDYYKKRLGEVDDVYRYLKLQQEEAEKYQDKVYRERVMGKLKTLYRQNYVERVTVVGSLRKMGVMVEDCFVPVSRA